MANDTQDPSPNPNSNLNPNPNTVPRGPPPGSTFPPSHIQSSSPKIYEIFPSDSNSVTPPESANALPPGSGLNTAGIKENVSLKEGWKTVRWQDFSQVHMYPCVRDAGLMGIGAGFGIGGLRGLFGASLMKCCNWAVGSALFGAAASYEYCLYRRRLEKQYMKRAVEIIDSKKAQKEKELEMKRKERREAKERMEREEEEKRRKSWWKVW